MIVGIDHIVLAVRDPDQAAQSLQDVLGLQASGGGRHERLGTFNRLVWLGDSYLELIGVFDPGLARDNWLGRPVLESLEDGGGIVTWAVAIDDLEAQLRWTPNEPSLTGPIEGERRALDGRVVRWRLVHPPSLSATSPFLIEHDTGAAEWTPDERRTRAAEVHPIGGRVRLGSLEIQAAVPAAVAARLRALLGTTAEPDGRRAVRVAIGDQAVRVVPVAAAGDTRATVELLTDAAVRRRTTRIGDCQIRLRGVARAPGSPTGGSDRAISHARPSVAPISDAATAKAGTSDPISDAATPDATSEPATSAV